VAHLSLSKPKNALSLACVVKTKILNVKVLDYEGFVDSGVACNDTLELDRLLFENVFLSKLVFRKTG